MPVFAVVAGISGIATNFSWIGPFRPFLIALTILTLGWAWYRNLKNRSEEADCKCRERSFWQSKKFLLIVTLSAIVLLALPSYSHIFFSGHGSDVLTVQEADLQTVQLDIQGMTCTGCEKHVEHNALQLDGVFEAKASYEESNASIKFDTRVNNIDVISAAIEKGTGYKVVSK